MICYSFKYTDKDYSSTDIFILGGRGRKKIHLKEEVYLNPELIQATIKPHKLLLAQVRVEHWVRSEQGGTKQERLKPGLPPRKCTET